METERILNDKEELRSYKEFLEEILYRSDLNRPFIASVLVHEGRSSVRVDHILEMQRPYGVVHTQKEIVSVLDDFVNVGYATKVAEGAYEPTPKLRHAVRAYI